jgi:CO dehydrogenase nickel-insertion accessory protein CooC1
MKKSQTLKKIKHKKRTHKKYKKTRTYKKNRSYSKRTNKNSLSTPIFEKNNVVSILSIGKPKNGSGIIVPGLRELL